MKKIFFFILILFISCQKEVVDEISFDASKWSIKKEMDYPFRNQMLHGLIKSDTLKKLKKDSILELLGKPERINENHLYYMIAQERLGFWPLHSKFLVIKVDKKGDVVFVKIYQ
ncbi:hypothetical protein [uncultured Flavobacterium sp.]|uniref:hypothetical protein n=1 Tax=uncultured Flavobacterium sp. TaxID=165435 RepID=UPI0030EBAC69|tara:strand:+ start:21493 stop:21834 length:342 start_codon:yes stop_codon:yes gene_type:complete